MEYLTVGHVSDEELDIREKAHMHFQQCANKHENEECICTFDNGRVNGLNDVCEYYLWSIENGEGYPKIWDIFG